MTVQVSIVIRNDAVKMFCAFILCISIKSISILISAPCTSDSGCASDSNTTDTCNTSSGLCECSGNTDKDACDSPRACQTVSGQPACSCQTASNCMDNADSCNTTLSTPECYCSTNSPNFTACETNKTCLPK